MAARQAITRPYISRTPLQVCTGAAEADSRQLCFGLAMPGTQESSCEEQTLNPKPLIKPYKLAKAAITMLRLLRWRASGPAFRINLGI